MLLFSTKHSYCNEVRAIISRNEQDGVMLCVIEGKARRTKGSSKPGLPKTVCMFVRLGLSNIRRCSLFSDKDPYCHDSNNRDITNRNPVMHEDEDEAKGDLVISPL